MTTRFPVLGMANALTGRVVLLITLMSYAGAGLGQGLRLLGVPLDTLLKTSAPRVDRAYITTYYRRLHLYVVSDRQDYTLRVAGSPYALLYKPNLAWTLGLGIDYKWLGTEITVKLPFLGYNIARRGKTTPFGATINLNNRRLWFSTQYQFYRGFYLNNPDILQPDWFDHYSAYPYRNDLRSQTVMSHALYQFNALQLSVPATLLQREAQHKKAGSWVVGGFLTYQHIQSDSSLIPSILQRKFSSDENLLRANTLALGIEAGYMQTFVFRNHLFASFMLRPGLSILYQQTSSVPTLWESQFRLGWEGVASLTVGYSSDVFYGGLYGSAMLVNRTFSPALLNTNAEYVRLVFGRRLRYQPKGIIKKLPGFK